MQLLPDEEIVWQANDFTLTNHRLRVVTHPGARSVQSVLLEQIQLCSLEFTHKPWLIAFSVLGFLAGIWQRTPYPFDGLCFLTAVVLAGCYLISRRTEIFIFTSGGAIHYPVRGKNIAFATELFDAVETAIISKKQAEHFCPACDELIP